MQVLLLRKPHITSADDIFYGDLDETAQIVCVAEMSPHKAKISWSFKVVNKLLTVRFLFVYSLGGGAFQEPGEV